MRPTLPLAGVIAALCACGGDDAVDPIDAAIDTASGDPDGAPPPDAPAADAPLDAPAAFTLTSTVISEGGVIPTMYSCQGVNVSPPLAWTGGPSAPGYAVVFTDITSPANPFLHSIIWDIPGATTSLPENVAKVAEPPVPAGAKQPLGYDNQTRGYLGPCPGSMHTYEYALYAVDEYPLSGVTLQSGRAAVRSAILAHDTASARLTATFTP